MILIRKLLLVLILIFTFSTLAYSQFKDASNEFSYAIKLYDQSFYDLAAQQFIKYYTNFPQSENADEAKFYAGMSLFLLKEYSNSRIEFQSLAGPPYLQRHSAPWRWRCACRGIGRLPACSSARRGCPDRREAGYQAAAVLARYRTIQERPRRPHRDPCSGRFAHSGRILRDCSPAANR